MAYARAGVPDYRIVNLRQRVVEIHREPVRAGRRSRYVISPLAAPEARISIADLLP